MIKALVICRDTNVFFIQLRLSFNKGGCKFVGWGEGGGDGFGFLYSYHFRDSYPVKFSEGFIVNNASLKNEPIKQ